MHGKRVRKGLISSILAAFLALGMSVAAFADYPAIDMDKEGSITVSMNTRSDGTGDPVAGGEMTIYQVAEVTMDPYTGDYSYNVITPFTGSSYNFEKEINGRSGADTGIDWAQLAQDLSDYVYEKDITGDTKEIDDNGTVTFTGLTPGLYLLLQMTPAEGYYAANPFLVSMPTYTEVSGSPSYSYTVNASPKTAVSPLPTKDVNVDVAGEEEKTYGDNGVIVGVGQTLTYEITYTNSRAVPAKVVITDTLDKNVEYISGSASAPSSGYKDYNFENNNGTLTWTINEVPARESGKVTFQVLVLDSAAVEGSVENTASAKIENDDEVWTETVWNPVPHKDVDVDTTDDKDYGDDGVYVEVGQTLTYKIEYQNGLETKADVIITDELDAGLDFISASDGGIYDKATRTITWTLKDVPSGTKGYVTFKAEVNEDATIVDHVDNTASVQVDGHPAVSTNTTRNKIREYFPIDEEIVTDTDNIFNRDRWVKEESINEYNAIEIEMTTRLPIIEIDDLVNGDFTMNFHEILDHELILDDDITDFSVYIDGKEISDYYYSVYIFNNNKEPDESAVSTLKVNAQDDGCTFHVDVRLTDLYKDGIINASHLLGDTEITIFFFADLEGTGLNGSYRSTVWYDVYDGDSWEYTSNVDVVEVYTYEIDVIKYDASTVKDDDYTGSALADATLGVYYDEECTEPVYRYRYTGRMTDENSERTAYTVTSGDDGYAVFYGLARGTYYVKETAAPSGYVLSDEVLTVTLGEESKGAVYEYANTPEPAETVPHTGSNTHNGGSSGGGVRPGTEGGPGADSAESTSTEGDSSSSGSSSSIVNADNIGGLPQTGESNMTIILIGLCAVFAVLLAGLFYMRRKTSKDHAL